MNGDTYTSRGELYLHHITLLPRIVADNYFTDSGRPRDYYVSENQTRVYLPGAN